MASPINAYGDLLAAIAALPAPRAGTVRVYRGQTKDYGNLTPSGLRKTPRNQAIWFAYSSMLHASLQAELIQQAKDGLSMEALQALGLWFAAVAQHYGPGSDYLDVTHSLDAALWFALNKTTLIETTGAIGPPGPPDPTADHPTRAELVRYDPWDETGYIFVLDLPVWDGQGLPGAGVIVDLALAPPLFSSSLRMQVQSGCLVNCRNLDGSSFDAQGLLVGRPLAVRRPMTGASGPVPMFDLRVADIYPSPARDAWFARYLSVPMIYAPEPTPPALQRPIPVTVYFDPGNQQYLEEVHFFDVALRLPLLHRAIPQFSLDAPASPDFQRPVAITLEAPLIFPYPTADSDQWNQGVLGSDVPDRSAWYEFGQEAPAGELRLDSVLFEFSLLEEVGWERVVRDGATIRSLRGVWLRRGGEWLEAAFLHQTMPASALDQVGFLSLRHDAASGRILFVPANGDAPVPMEQLGEFGKAVFIALMLLRYLSPKLKCEPSPRLVTGPLEMPGEEQPLYKMLVGVAGDAARLYRVPAQAPNPDWYVLRDATNPQEPFTHVTRRAGALQLESHRPFRDFPVEELVINPPAAGSG